MAAVVVVAVVVAAVVVILNKYMKKIKLNIIGMHCASCVVLSEKTIKKIDGVKSVVVSLTTNQALIEYDEGKINIESLIKAIESIGYKAELAEKTNLFDKENASIKKAYYRFLGAAVLSLPVMAAMLFMNFKLGIVFIGVDLIEWIYLVLTLVIVFVFGWHFHISAFKQLKKGNTNMDTLVSLGTLTAFFYSVWAMFNNQFVYFEAAAAIITLINLGKWLEAVSRGKASQSIKKLLQLGVKEALLINNGKEVLVPVEKLKVDDILLIKVGDKIPLDGQIIEGATTIDESMLTGESMPASKNIGDDVFGATINQGGVIKVKVTKVGEDTILAQIIRMVEEAQTSKAPIQKLADYIAGIFVPSVIGISLVTFISWYLVTNDLTASIIPAVAVLVISCPCALGLATPTAIMVGTGLGAKNGILIKSGEILEKSKKIDVVIFDKTGTLTKGQPVVTDIWAIDDNKTRLLKIARSLTKLSNHPLSESIVDYVSKQEIEPVALENFSEISGRGVMGQCRSHGTNLLLGNQQFIEDNNLKIDSVVMNLADKYANEGKTVVFVSHGLEVIGLLALMDTPKEDAVQAVKDLQILGLEIYMITGDNDKTAQAVGNSLGISNIFSQVMPQDKANKVKALQETGKKVAFVGDGINDAPALAQADLGIAMGTGTDIAIETGDIVLMKGSPSKVVSSIKLSQKTFNTIKQNLFWAFIYNIVCIPIAALGLLNPIFASLAMSFSSVSVVTNSLRIKKYKL